MALQYYQARASLNTDPKQSWLDDYQQFIDYGFENASDIFTIQEELLFGTKVYSDVLVRINHAVNTTTGTKLGDDYRTLLFQDMTHAKGLGYRYQFNDNTWLTNNSDLYKYSTASTTVRRCNNSLKWHDSFGVLQEEPCIIDYEFSGTKLTYDKTINVANGGITVVAQYNNNTKNIRINDRFIFNGQAFKIEAINSFFQNKTGVSDTVPLLTLSMFSDSESINDDLANNIADRNVHYTIEINDSQVNNTIGYTKQLSATVKLNGNVVNLPVVWTSNAPTIASVSSSGLLTLIANGSCAIKATMQDNVGVYTTINATVQAIVTPSREIIITPNVSEILQGKTVQYVGKLYVNGIEQVGAPISWSTSGVATSNYSAKLVDNNKVEITNIRFSTTPLILTATNGITSINKSVKLKGVY